MPKSNKSKSNFKPETPFADIPAYTKRKAPKGLAKKTAQEVNDLLTKEEVALEALIHMGNIEQDKMSRARAAKKWASMNADERVEYAKERSTLTAAEKAFMHETLEEEAYALKSKVAQDKKRVTKELKLYNAAKNQFMKDGSAELDFDKEPMGRAAASKYRALADEAAEYRKADREEARKEQHAQELDQTPKRLHVSAEESSLMDDADAKPETEENRRKSSRYKEAPKRLPVTFTSAKSYEEPAKATSSYISPQPANYIDVRWGPDWYTGTVLSVFPNPDDPEKKRMLVYYDADNTWFFHDLPLELGNEWRYSTITPDRTVKEFIDPDDEGTYRVNYITAEVKLWRPGSSPPPLTDSSNNSSTPSPKMG